MYVGHEIVHNISGQEYFDYSSPSSTKVDTSPTSSSIKNFFVKKTKTYSVQSNQMWI